LRASDPEGYDLLDHGSRTRTAHEQDFCTHPVSPEKWQLSVSLNGGFLKEATSLVFNSVRPWIALPAVLFLFLVSERSEAQENTSKESPKPQMSVATGTAGPVEKQTFKKRTPEEIFEALNAVLRAMNSDMEDFNFDRVHPHLKIIYSLYNELRLLSLDNIDSLTAHSGHAHPAAAARNIGAVHYDASDGWDSVAARTGSRASPTIDTGKALIPSSLQQLSIRPLIDLKNNGAAKAGKDSALLGSVSSVSFSWDDTSFQKYMLKFEITPDSTGAKVWNVVFEKVDKLKNRTAKIHQYFDLGEFAVSAQDLIWLTDELKKSETEMRSYFYDKEHEKEMEKKDTILLK
jgi:hypothetical protein